MTDVAAALGIRQLERAEELRLGRERVAQKFNDCFSGVEAIQIPSYDPEKRRHSWHLYSIRLQLDNLKINRSQFIEHLVERGVFCSVHWLPLHMMPYYRERYGYCPEDFPFAASQWPRLVSLPIFPTMRDDEIDHVIKVVTEVAKEHEA